MNFGNFMYSWYFFYVICSLRYIYLSKFSKTNINYQLFAQNPFLILLLYPQLPQFPFFFPAKLPFNPHMASWIVNPNAYPELHNPGICTTKTGKFAQQNQPSHFKWESLKSLKFCKREKKRRKIKKGLLDIYSPNL